MYSFIFHLAISAATVQCTVLPITPRAFFDGFSLPIDDLNAIARAQAIQLKRHTFLYGPGPDQNVTVYPSGLLGNAMVLSELTTFQQEATSHKERVDKDIATVTTAVQEAGGIRTLADFSILFDGHWKNSVGDTVDGGYFTNYTNDLLFSMERLSINAFSLRRLDPSEPLPFPVDPQAATKVSTTTIDNLHSQGRLFYIDYTLLSKIPRQEGRHSAACEAYFFIHPESDDFLPLAIKTNEGSDLVYTPADSHTDWLFAKILFGQNEVWYAPWYHFASTHLTVETPYYAAIRCMSDDHPILAAYTRLMRQATAMRQFAQSKLYAAGQNIDSYYAYSGASARQFTSDIYNSGAGNFQSNYYETQFTKRGLFSSPHGPRIKHFPFAEDATPINNALKSFMATLINSYYRNPTQLSEDNELQCWFTEVQTAKGLDFPTDSGSDTSTLIDILTHVAFLVSVQHQSLNTNDQFINALLPLNPAAIYKPLPTSKGLAPDDLLAFLPNATQAIGQTALAASFARPEFVGSEKTLVNMFNDKVLLNRLNGESRAAEGKFREEMLRLSDVVKGRAFDGEGLSQGAPFLFKALDPNVAPYSLTI